MTDPAGLTDSAGALAPPAAAGPDDRFEVVFEGSPFSIQMLAADGTTKRVNKAWERLWQVSDEDGSKAWVLSGQYNVLTDPQLEANGVTPLLRAAFAGQTVEIPALRYDPAEMGKSGRARWVRAAAHPIRGADGQVHEVVLMHEDVTQRFESAQALRESEERLRLATDAARIGIWDWDVDRDKVTWTPEVYALHGIAPGTFGGRAQDFADRVHEGDRPFVWERIQHALATEGGFTAEFRVCLPEGGDRWLSTSSRVYRGPDGGKRMVGATFSIDSFKKAEAALRESDRRKDEFLAMLAHELRNPLAPIRTAAEILQQAAGDPSRVRRASDIISRQLGHAVKLVDDLLDVSRVTRGLAAIESKPVDLVEVMALAAEQARPFLEAHAHRFTTRVLVESAVVLGDRARLVQAIVNLLSNAARYTPDGGTVELELHRSGDEACVLVRDNGQGIEPDFMPYVFDLFSQGPRSLARQQGGLGIGLALVRRLAELHGGRIEASSDGAGQGSRFTLRLPLARGVRAEESAGSRPAGAKAARSILVVDDNQDAADSLATLLQLHGHRASACFDAASALAHRDLEEFDLFLLDIGLPDLDGISLGQELRARRPDAQFIVTSGYGQAADLERSSAAGFARHLVKPVSWEALCDAIDRASREATAETRPRPAA